MTSKVIDRRLRIQSRKIRINIAPTRESYSINVSVIFWQSHGRLAIQIHGVVRRDEDDEPVNTRAISQGDRQIARRRSIGHRRCNPKAR